MQTISFEKPTLVQLLNRHRVNMIRLAQAANISLETIRAMARRQPVQLIVVHAILYGLYRLSGVSYRLEDVDIALIPLSYVVGSIQAEREALEACQTIMMNERG